MRDLTDLLNNPRSTVTLDRAALDIAQLEYPDLQPEPWLKRLDAIASDVDGQCGRSAAGAEFVESMNDVLFGRLKLLGNEREYYDVRNSCLNDVLERRLGIPITLSVIYMEVARRLGRPVYGIGLPSHFVVQYADASFDSYIDPFHGGELLTKSDCAALVRERTGVDPPPSSFIPCLPKQIVLRMLQNLKAIYVSSGLYDKAARTMDAIISGGSVPADEYKQRAVVLLQLRRYGAAMTDLQTYLSSEPNAADRSDVIKQIEAIHRYLAALN